MVRDDKFMRLSCE